MNYSLLNNFEKGQLSAMNASEKYRIPWIEHKTKMDGCIKLSACDTNLGLFVIRHSYQISLNNIPVSWNETASDTILCAFAIAISNYR